MNSISVTGTYTRRYRKLGKFSWKNQQHSPVNFRPKTQLSARKLAAGLWHLRFLEVSSSFHFSNSQFQLESSSPQCLKCSKEEVTLSGPALSGASDSDVFASRKRKLVTDQRKLIGDSVVAALLPQLLRAQTCINKLKAEHRSSKKKLQQFVHKLEEEKVLWKRREHDKVQAMVDELKDKLAKERRSRERMELLNTKLVHELAETKLYAKQAMINYEEEKKERELVVEVCKELAMQIGEDKAKLQGLQRHFIKIREQVEEERNMFQMLELWLEESIQMKLVDAKLALEDKYNQMIQLIAYLQAFLRSKGDELDPIDLRDAQLFKQVAESLNIQNITELSYDFRKSNDVFPIYEELRNGSKVNERVIKSDSPPNLTGPSSTIHISLEDEDHLNNISLLHDQSSTSNDYSTGLQVDVQNLCLAPERRGTSLDNVNQDRNISGNEAECYVNTDLDSLKKGVNGAFSVSIGQSNWKAFSASELLRSCQSDGTSNCAAKTCQCNRPEDYGCYKHHDSVAQQNLDDLTFDECKGRLTQGSIQSGVITSTFMCKGTGEGGFRHWELLGQGNSADTMNPHVTRGMKGCIEWP
ncbi:hypothetical protein SESBI_09857 [Sesbania bispinosa]|nr:hypothetical protein SESBI_09857 [Sesbania bispinosa]